MLWVFPQWQEELRKGRVKFVKSTWGFVCRLRNGAS